MKYLLLVMLFVPVFSGSNVETITRAISTGDVTTLGKFFDETVEIALPGEEDIYEKAKATELLKNFFSKHTPKGFAQAHQGTSKGNDSVYCIGNLTTSTGTFRVYIYLHADDGNYLIQELRFDKA